MALMPGTERLGRTVGRMNHRNAQDRFIEDVRARQQNTLWLDVMVNGSSVDGPLWRGSPNATKVQRIGIAIFGLAFGCIGAACELGAYEKRELFLALYGLPWQALAARLFLNAFKRNPNSTNAKKR
jgi:hypothetical protein